MMAHSHALSDQSFLAQSSSMLARLRWLIHIFCWFLWFGSLTCIAFSPRITHSLPLLCLTVWLIHVICCSLYLAQSPSMLVLFTGSLLYFALSFSMAHLF